MDPYEKHILQSKTVWANLLGLVAIICVLVWGNEFDYLRENKDEAAMGIATLQATLSSLFRKQARKEIRPLLRRRP